jgi:hypothetical protein
MASRSAPGSSRAPSSSFKVGLILRLQSRFIFGNKGADLIGVPVGNLIRLATEVESRNASVL